MSLSFDIGANEGLIANKLSKRFDSVIAFEPNPNLIKALEKKFAGTNVIVDKRGIDKKDGDSIFNICNSSNISTFSQDWIDNSRFSGEHYWEIKLNVPVITIDSAIKQYGIPDYIKIDVEGYEYEVLQGLTMLLDNTVVCFEWAEEQKQKILDSIEYLHSIGYNAFSYTYGDDFFMETELGWTDKNSLDLHETLDETRKIKWGMVYFKRKKCITDMDFTSPYNDISLSTTYAAYINLDSRPDRNDRIITELRRVNIEMERMSAFAWRPLYDGFSESKKKQVDVMLRRTPGAIGCHYSQVAVMEKALSLNKHAFVNEDDIIFCDDIHERLDIIFDFLNGTDWDIFWMGGTYHKEPTWHKSIDGKHTHPDLQNCDCTLNKDWEETDNKNIVRTYGAFSTHSYIVNKKSIKNILWLLEDSVHLSMGIDWIMILQQPKLRTFAFNYGCCKQYDNPSSIGDGVSKFSGFAKLGEHWFKDKL